MTFRHLLQSFSPTKSKLISNQRRNKRAPMISRCRRKIDLGSVGKFFLVEERDLEKDSILRFPRTWESLKRCRLRSSPKNRFSFGIGNQHPPKTTSAHYIQDRPNRFRYSYHTNYLLPHPYQQDVQQ